MLLRPPSGGRAVVVDTQFIQKIQMHSTSRRKKILAQFQQTDITFKKRLPQQIDYKFLRL